MTAASRGPAQIMVSGHRDDDGCRGIAAGVQPAKQLIPEPIELLELDFGAPEGEIPRHQHQARFPESIDPGA